MRGPEIVYVLRASLSDQVSRPCTADGPEWTESGVTLSVVLLTVREKDWRMAGLIRRPLLNIDRPLRDEAIR